MTFLEILWDYLEAFAFAALATTAIVGMAILIVTFWVVVITAAYAWVFA